MEPLGGYLHLGRQLSGAKGADFCESWNFGPNNSANKNVGEVVRTSSACGAAAGSKIERDPNAPHEDRGATAQLRPRQPYLHWSPTLNYPDSIDETVSWYRRLPGGRRHSGAHRFADREVREGLKGGGP